jgi:hypothetical protein
MEAVLKAILFLCVFGCSQSYAQHRIKLQNNTSLFVSISELSEDSIYFHFPRQAEEYAVSRGEVSKLQNLVWDPTLLINNFQLKSPYQLEDFRLDDVVIFNKYQKFNELNYRKLDAKVLAIEEDTIRFITFIDTRYIVVASDKSELEVINYAQASKIHLIDTENEDSYMDILQLESGKQKQVYLYEMGYQGIKYSEEPLASYNSAYIDGDIKSTGIGAMKFMSYSEITSIRTYDGYIFLSDNYSPVVARKVAKLRPYPKVEFSLGIKYAIRLNNSTEISSLRYVNDLLTKEEPVSNLNALFSPVDFKIWVHLPKNIALLVGYDYSFSEKASFKLDRFYDNGQTYFGDMTYRTRLHTFRLGSGYSIAGFRVSAHANTVLSRSPFTWQEVGYFGPDAHTGATYQGFIKSRAYIRWGADVGYTVKLGKVSIEPSLGYEQFEIDFDNTTKNKATLVEYSDALKAFASPTRGLRFFRDNFAPSLTEWNVVSAKLSVNYKF